MMTPIITLTCLLVFMALPLACVRFRWRYVRALSLRRESRRRDRSRGIVGAARRDCAGLHGDVSVRIDVDLHRVHRARGGAEHAHACLGVGRAVTRAAEPALVA